MNQFEEIANPSVLALQPRVSVLVFAYAQKDTLEQTIASIAGQRTSVPFEIILSEDCSPDGTRELARRLQATYPDLIRLLLPARNLGATRNFALGLSAVRGEYVALCEGDDYWLDDGKIERQVVALDRHRQVDLCFTNGIGLYADGSTGEVAGWDYGDEPRRVSAAEILAGFGWLAPSASLMWRASVTRPWPEWLLQAPFLDLPILIATSRRGGAWYDPTPTIAYRIAHPASFTVRMASVSHRVRAARAAEAVRTLRRSCAEFGLPVDLLSHRLQDMLLSEVRHHLAAGDWAKAARRSLGFRPSFLLGGTARRLRRMLGQRAAPGRP